MRILIFGDSIAQGFYDSKGGWVNRMVNESYQKTASNLGGEWVEIFNLGVSGDVISNILDRLEDETKARKSDDKIFIVIAAGINNSVLIDNHAYMDVYKFQEQLEKLVKKLKDISDGCMFIGLTAIDESLTNPFAQSSTGNQYLNNRINLFEDCIKQVCEQTDVPFVPVHDMFIGQLNNRSQMLTDGLHPNEAGHSLLYEIIAPEIKKLIS